MDFAFSEEQQMLREQARSFLADRVGPDRVVELATSDDAWDPATWKQMAELGWIGLALPEESGGGGMGFLEEAVLLEEFGYALYPGPYLSSVILALPALAAGGADDAIGRIVSGESAATLAWAEPSGSWSLVDVDSMGTKASPTNGGWSLTGEKELVPDLGAASDIVVSATTSDGVGLFLVSGEDASATASATVDATRRLGRLSLQETPAGALVEGERAAEVLAGIRLRALAAVSLEAVGVAQRALELAQQHVKERKQFDKPIGTYQAVSHQVANTYVETELARSLSYWAAWCVGEPDGFEHAPAAVAAAKSCAADAAVAACERSIQVHGGIGFTWEHILHRYYKRAQWIDSFEGFGSNHRAAVAAKILDGGP